MREFGVDCLDVQCDVRDPDSTDAMTAAVFDRFGRVDVVVANAGIAGAIRPMHEITYEEWHDRPLLEKEDVAAWTRTVVPPAARAFWSFQPLKAIEPPAVKNASWARTPRAIR